MATKLAWTTKDEGSQAEVRASATYVMFHCILILCVLTMSVALERRKKAVLIVSTPSSLTSRTVYWLEVVSDPGHLNPSVYK